MKLYALDVPGSEAARDCSPPVPWDCAGSAVTGKNLSMQRRLCLGISEILAADCGALRNRTHLAALIRRVGLAQDNRGGHLYGEESTSMVAKGQRRNFYQASQGGLYQDPVQLAGTMIFLSRTNTSTYLELGVFTGWTACLNSAYVTRSNLVPTLGRIDASGAVHMRRYLTRFAHAGSFAGLAVDVKTEQVLCYAMLC